MNHPLLNSWFSVFPVHGFSRNDSLLPILAYINTVNKFPIRDRFTKRTFVKTPKGSCVAECYQSIKWCNNTFSILPKFIAGKVKLIIPNDSVSPDIHSYSLELFQKFFLFIEYWPPIAVYPYL